MQGPPSGRACKSVTKSPSLWARQVFAGRPVTSQTGNGPSGQPDGLLSHLIGQDSFEKLRPGPSRPAPLLGCVRHKIILDRIRIKIRIGYDFKYPIQFLLRSGYNINFEIYIIRMNVWFVILKLNINHGMVTTIHDSPSKSGYT